MTRLTLPEFLIARLSENPTAGDDAARRVVANLTRVGEFEDKPCRRCGDKRFHDVRDFILWELAQPYADHPDYDAGWSPW